MLVKILQHEQPQGLEYAFNALPNVKCPEILGSAVPAVAPNHIESHF